jgi:hypothetical protein
MSVHSIFISSAYVDDLLRYSHTVHVPCMQGLAPLVDIPELERSILGRGGNINYKHFFVKPGQPDGKRSPRKAVLESGAYGQSVLKRLFRGSSAVGVLGLPCIAPSSAQCTAADSEMRVCAKASA